MRPESLSTIWRVRGGTVAIRVMPCLFVTFGLAKLVVAWRYRRHA